MPQRLDGDLYLGGNLVPGGIVYPAGAILNAHVSAGADVAADKLEHYFSATYGQANAAAADETRVIYVARAAGEVLEFSAGSIAAAIGDATCTVDLKKNGSSILSAVITLDSANTARVIEDGTISGGTFVAGDVLEIVIDGTIGTGTLPTGVFASAKIREKAA